MLVDGSGNVSILGVHVDDDLAFVGIETNILAGEANLAADSSGNLLEIDLGLVDADFSEKNDLKDTEETMLGYLLGCVVVFRTSLIKICAKSKSLTIPVLVAVSMATLQLGSTLRHASRIPSET